MFATIAEAVAPLDVQLVISLGASGYRIRARVRAADIVERAFHTARPALAGDQGLFGPG